MTAFVSASSDGLREVRSPIAGASPLARALALFFATGGTSAWVAPALTELGQVPSLNLVAFPDLIDLAGAAYRSALTDAVAVCVARRLFLIVDPPADATSVEAMAQQAMDLASIVAEHGAIYWPPLRDQSGLIAPSGGVAAIYARTDTTRGVWKSPAGVDAVLPGVSPAYAIGSRENEVLNHLGVNVLRTFPSAGTVVWGARTMAGHGEFRYVPVRRMMIFLEESIRDGMTWTVYEPNEPPLWMKVRDAIGQFLLGIWKAGGLIGLKPENAFFIRCDSTTMTADDIANGRLIVLIGVAPLRPAEFIIFRIGLWASAP